VAVGTTVTFAAGVVFGLALAAPPGPMNAIIAEESVLRGWIEGFKAGLGAMTADLIFFLLALVGIVAVVERFPTLQAVMITVGGVLMLYFAVDAARNVETALTGDTETVPPGRGFRKALVLGLTNPYQILFWLTVGVSLLDPGRVDVLSYTPYVGEGLAGTLVVETGSPALLAGLFGGIVIWVVGFPAALIAGRRRIDALAPIVAAGSALVLAGFGCLFLWDGLTTLL
jgi:threonine/homoserine/homoserine lactone efflux protein